MNSKTVVESYTRRERNAVFISALGGYWLDFYNILVMSFLMSSIQKSLDVSLTQAGIVTSVTLVSSILGGIVFGWIGDRYGRKTALMWSFGLFSVAAIASAFSWGYVSLLVFRAIAGVGIGGEWGLGMTLYNEVSSPRRRGFGSAVIQSMSLIGIATASVVSSWALSTFGAEYGWRVALLFGALPLVFLALVRIYMPESKAWLEHRKLEKAGIGPDVGRVPLFDLFKSHLVGRTVASLLMLCGYMYAFYSASIFVPTYMSQSLGGSTAGVGFATTLAALLCVPVYWLIGFVSDAWGRKPAVLLVSMVMLIALAGMFLFTQGSAYHGSILHWSIFWWYLLWTVGAGSICIFGPWLSELYPVNLRSTATSTIYMAGRTMSAAAPAVVGVVAGASGSIILGIATGAGGLVLMIVCAFLLPETVGVRMAPGLSSDGVNRPVRGA